jgi:hypothetical protein
MGQAYSVRDAARRVRRCRKTIQRWMSEGMPHRRLGTHRVEIDEDDLCAWLRDRILGQKASRFRAKDAA